MTQIKEIDNEVDNEPPLDHDIGYVTEHFLK